MEENFNIHLGKKLRMRRLSLGLTQTKVAQAINVTFQQIQKYEKGTNGVSSNRLMQLSQFLKVPIIYFFEDYKEFKDVNPSEDINDDLNYSFLSRTFSSLSSTPLAFLRSSCIHSSAPKNGCLHVMPIFPIVDALPSDTAVILVLIVEPIFSVRPLWFASMTPDDILLFR